ncbi:MAG TPA: serine/threonine-protein kinase, partial [Byssovorax sp.]
MSADEEQDPALADTDRPAGGSGRAVEGPAPESSYSAVPGALLAGKYRVVRALGKGGGGVVLEARHEQLDACVAMKLLNPELVLQPGAAARFLREAKAAARLTSPHVTRVLDVGTLASGEPFLVMELLAGEDLASWSHRIRVAGEPPTVARVLDLMTQACAGVAAAHAAGVVHRDLKPANLFLTELTRGAKDAGVVKVLDFGVSKVVDLPTGEGGLTTTSTVLGSVLYMSPEQM